MNTTQISKLISLVLRHHPERLGLALDAHGWADTSALIDAINAIDTIDCGDLFNGKDERERIEVFRLQDIESIG